MARVSTVLIVDQNIDRRFKMKQLVLEAKFEVCGEVGYGTAAVSLAAEVKPDIIMCAMEKLLTRSAQTVESLIDTLPETPVVVYSPDSQLAVARQAMSTGARDFLAMPISRDELKQSIVAALGSAKRRRERLAGSGDSSPRGVVLTVFGPKGGIGKTTVVTNLSVSLARFGQSVVTVDADAGFGDVTGMLDIQPERTIVELSQHIGEVTRETLPRFLLPHSSGLMVLAAPPLALDWRKVSTESFHKIIEALARSFDVVIIDTSGTLDELSLEALLTSSFVLWITTTEYSSIKDSQAAVRALRQMSFPEDRIRLLINEISPVKDVSPAAVAETLQQPIFWHLPYDRKLRRSAQLGRPVVEMDPSSRIARNFMDLARRISGVTAEREPRLLDRVRGRKNRRSPADEPAITPALRGEET